MIIKSATRVQVQRGEDAVRRELWLRLLEAGNWILDTKVRYNDLYNELKL
jgi:hypothetical protein